MAISGLVAKHLATASLPSTASATISHPGCASRIWHSPSLTTTWSSAIRIRVTAVIIPSVPSRKLCTFEVRTPLGETPSPLYGKHRAGAQASRQGELTLFAVTRSLCKRSDDRGHVLHGVAGRSRVGKTLGTWETATVRRTARRAAPQRWR